MPFVEIKDLKKKKKIDNKSFFDNSVKKNKKHMRNL